MPSASWFPTTPPGGQRALTPSAGPCGPPSMACWRSCSRRSARPAINRSMRQLAVRCAVGAGAPSVRYVPPYCRTLRRTAGRPGALEAWLNPAARDAADGDPRSPTSARIGPYEGSLRAIVQALKYGRTSDGRVGLGVRLRAVASDVLSRRRRRRSRPAPSLAGARAGIQSGPRDRAASGCADDRAPCAGHAEQRSQADLPAARRHRNVRGAFVGRQPVRASRA